MFGRQNKIKIVNESEGRHSNFFVILCDKVCVVTGGGGDLSI